MHGNGIGVPPVFFKKSLGLVAHDHEVVMLPQFEQTMTTVPETPCLFRQTNVMPTHSHATLLLKKTHSHATVTHPE